MNPRSKHPTLQRLNDHLAKLTRPFSSRDEVNNFLVKERADHPADLATLADTMVATYMVGVATDWSNALRKAARSAVLREATEDLARSIIDDTQRPGMFAVRFVVDKENTRKTVAEMDGKDHNFVARGYLSDAKTSQMEAAFHKAIAKKVGRSATGEVMNEETYEELYRSIVGPPRADAA